MAIDVDDLFAHCDPERENLCLYGKPFEVVSLSRPGGDPSHPSLGGRI